MKVVLSDALHARPANLIVRLASRLAAQVEISFSGTRANARSILDILALGAAKGDEVELHAAGEDAAGALRTVVELLTRGFDRDLVPELGASAVEGIASGRAVVAAPAPPSQRSVQSMDDETSRLEGALLEVAKELDAVIYSLSPQEAELFEPEREILRDIGKLASQSISAGKSAEEGVEEATRDAQVDLVHDARARLLAALSDDAGPSLSDCFPEDTSSNPLIFVTRQLTPSVVASLPKNVRGIIAAVQGSLSPEPSGLFTSHAAILAQERGLPLVFASSSVVDAIEDGMIVVMDTVESPARIWTSPSDELLEIIREREAARKANRDKVDSARVESLHHLGVAIRANVGSAEERIHRAAEGIGLLRTELVFAAKKVPPTEEEHFAAMTEIASRVRGGHATVIRLFDAGGDKVVRWLTPRDSDKSARGITLLLQHPMILETQLRGIARASKVARVKILIPLVRHESDVMAVKERVGAAIEVGALIESVEAVNRIDAIAEASDFISVGSNDLAANILGATRDQGAVAIDPTLFTFISRVVEGGHARGRTVTVCGEIASNPVAARILVGLGVDALSVTSTRIGALRSALAETTLDECTSAARAAIHGREPNGEKG